MLINNDREIFLATSGNYSQAKISRILINRVSVSPSKGERVEIVNDAGSDRVVLDVYLSTDIVERLELNLIRYEFLSRIAEDGALPASFSKECYEDILAFKSQLLAAVSKRDKNDDDVFKEKNEIIVLSLSDQGMAEENCVEVIP
jgi:hypothetical protein